MQAASHSVTSLTSAPLFTKSVLCSLSDCLQVLSNLIMISMIFVYLHDTHTDSLSASGEGYLVWLKKKRKGKCKKRKGKIFNISCSFTSRCVLIALILDDPSRIFRMQYSFVIACLCQRKELNQYSMACDIVWLMNLYRTLYPHMHSFVYCHHHLILQSHS